MIRTKDVIACLFLCVALAAADDKPSSSPSFDYDTARTHERAPHRRILHLPGVRRGFNQLHLTLLVSPFGEVKRADAFGDPETMNFWPQCRDEVLHWKFTPFRKDGKPVSAEVEEYIDLVPPERLPTHHFAAPTIRSDSTVAITLTRLGCYGTCPAYTVTVSTDGIEFDGHEYVIAKGKHKAKVDPEQVRRLAKRFVDADFYSMDKEYVASVTDNPGYTLRVAIDGQAKEVLDYVGEEVGMPEVISELEREVDAFAHTEQWVAGTKK